MHNCVLAQKYTVVTPWTSVPSISWTKILSWFLYPAAWSICHLLIERYDRTLPWPVEEPGGSGQRKEPREQHQWSCHPCPRVWLRIRPWRTVSKVGHGVYWLEKVPPVISRVLPEHLCHRSQKRISHWTRHQQEVNYSICYTCKPMHQLFQTKVKV